MHKIGYKVKVDTAGLVVSGGRNVDIDQQLLTSGKYVNDENKIRSGPLLQVVEGT